MIEQLTNALKAHSASLDQSAGQAKFAIVTSIDYTTGWAKVSFQPDGVLSGWLPVLSQWIGSGWGLVCPLTPGDQVLVLPQDGDAQQGVIVGGSYSRDQMPPQAPGGEFWIIHKSGAGLKLANDGTIRISGDLHVDGDVYDRTGALSHLRTTYNAHTHIAPPNATTSAPSPLES